VLRRLLVMRHAKSGYPTGVSDHARPLGDRGRRDAPRVGHHLAERGLVPDAVLVSDAERTRETWALLAPSLVGVTPRFTRALYLAPVADVVREIRGTPDRVATLLLVGHNPTSEDLILDLCDVSVTMPTAACAVLEGEFASWSDAGLASGLWRLVEVFRPSDLDW
jgi:phosphohistidine phosphatase